MSRRSSKIVAAELAPTMQAESSFTSTWSGPIPWEDILPIGVNHAWPTFREWPRCLSAQEAARYLGISRSMFLDMVAAGEMPKPTKMRSRRVWDRRVLDDKVTSLSADRTALPSHDEVETLWGRSK